MSRQGQAEKLTDSDQQSKNYTFIVSSTAPQSRKSYEIQLAEAKSHAARETHRKRVLLPRRDETASTRDNDDNADSTSAVSAGSSSVTRHHQVHLSITSGGTRPPSPFPGFGCFREELVATFPEVDQPHVSKTIDFWCHMVNPGIYLFTELFNIGNPHPLFLSLMSHRVFYHVGFSVVWLVLQHQFDPVPKSSRLTDLHRGLAVTRIREQLEHDQNSTGIAAAIVWLATLDFSLGARDRALLHLDGLSAYLARRGGIGKLSADEKEFVLHFGSSLTLLSSVKFITLPADPKIRYNASYDVCLIPRGFRTLISKHDVSPDAIELLIRAAEINMEIDSVRQDSKRSAARHKTRRYHNCVEACPVLLAPDSEQNMISKMICFSMLLYSHLNIASGVPFGWGRLSYVYLKSKVEQRDPSTMAESNFYIWVCALLIHSQRGSTFSIIMSDEVTGSLRKLLQHFSRYESRQWSDVEEILNGFFWPSQLAKIWERSWIDMIGHADIA